MPPSCSSSLTRHSIASRRSGPTRLTSTSTVVFHGEEAIRSEWWALVLQSAQAQASQELVSDRVALLADQQALEQARERWVAEAATLQAQVQASQNAERLASAQATQLQYRVDQLQDHLRALTEERDAAQAWAAQAETALLASSAEAAPAGTGFWPRTTGSAAILHFA